MLEKLTVNIAGSAKRQTMAGRDYIVVPMVMLTEGIHAGSAGPLFYPAAELARNVSLWDHKPIVVYHPEENGAGISACDPNVLTNRGVGVILNTKAKGGKLRAEAWLEITRLNAVDDRILNAIESGNMMEISTGLFTDNEKTEGEWNGAAYDTIARNYRPDHLAILPDKKGACSIADGAGLMRNEAKDQRGTLTANELSFDEIREELSELLPMNSWVCDVFQKSVIYSTGGDGDRKLYQVGYAVDKDDAVTLQGEPVEVIRYSEYRTADGKPIRNEAIVMERKDAVTALIANNAGFTEAEREWLTGIPQAQFDTIAKMAKPAPVANTAPANPPAQFIQRETPPGPTTNATPAPPAVPTLQEYINNAPPELRDVLADGVVTLNLKKMALVKAITANTANTFTAEYLQTLPTQHLEAIAALAQTPQPVGNGRTQSNYAGAAGVFATNTAAPQYKEQAALPIPVMTWDK